jgi:very-short-patch-repair endonuclease
MYGLPRKGLPTPRCDALHIYPQVSLDGYRLDFLAIQRCEGEPDKVTVIEVDGHDFHERTKAQASHDKKRDRHFTKKGWQVLRYTGSDVWRSPSECAREIIYTACGCGDEV